MDKNDLVTRYILPIIKQNLSIDWCRYKDRYVNLPTELRIDIEKKYPECSPDDLVVWACNWDTAYIDVFSSDEISNLVEILVGLYNTSIGISKYSTSSTLRSLEMPNVFQEI
jgi:hypothetical protein